MYTEYGLKEILSAISEGGLTPEQALEKLRNFPFQDIGHTKIDSQRLIRSGLPEVIYAAGKTHEQVADIFLHMQQHSNVLATRVCHETAAYVRLKLPQAEYNSLGKTLCLVREKVPYGKGEVAIVTAGTSDVAVAEEARVTCEMSGCRTTFFQDVGVAGIHRLLDKADELQKATVVIAIAGMEGALASVVGGLVAKPVIAVPTSVGYGANFSGLSALLGMLTSCAGGVTVVNIDNGFGAACAACKICSLLEST